MRICALRSVGLNEENELGDRAVVENECRSDAFDATGRGRLDVDFDPASVELL